MAASKLKTGGSAVVANTATALAPVILFAPFGTTVADDLTAADADGGAANAYYIKNSGTTDGTTASTDLLFVHLIGVHHASEGIPLMPGDAITVVLGFNGNGCRGIKAWTRNAGNTGAAAGNLLVLGGIQKANS